MPDAAPHIATPLQRNLPNALTLARLVLAAIFFILLSIPARDALTHHPARSSILIAAIIFILAAATDFLDGHLARRWNVVSRFGRILDPFADKILVLGAFVILAGGQFIAPSLDGGTLQTTGVLPWMAILILARELLITSLRGLYESAGIDFSAIWAGKLKMILQSIAVPIILFTLFIWYDNPTRSTPRTINLITAYATTIITALSAIPYITKAMRSKPA